MNMTNIVEEHPSVVSKKYILDANDRCDKCRAQSMVRIKGKSGELMFCSHHYEKIMNDHQAHEKMMSFMLEVLDEREKLIANKPIGAI